MSKTSKSFTLIELLVVIAIIGLLATIIMVSVALQQQDGVTAPNGTYFHYGNDSNGIITVGKNYK